MMENDSIHRIVYLNILVYCEFTYVGSTGMVGVRLDHAMNLLQ